MITDFKIRKVFKEEQHSRCMKAKLFCYNLEKLSSSAKNKCRKELLGHNDSSHDGKYRYQRPGLLQKIWNQRPVRSVVIVKERDSSGVIRVFEKYDVRYNTYEIKEE